MSISYYSSFKYLNNIYPKQLLFLGVTCTYTNKKARFGNLVSCKEGLCFYTERKGGKRKAIEIIWWDIVDISTTTDSITVSTTVSILLLLKK